MAQINESGTWRKAGGASSATVLFGSVYLVIGESRPGPDDEDRRVPLSWVGANHVKPPRSDRAVPGRAEAHRRDALSIAGRRRP